MKMRNVDKNFPIFFLILAIIVTFGIFLVTSMNATITGAAIGGIFSGWTIVWFVLILITMFIGISILHKN